MNAPRVREYQGGATRPVRRQKTSFLRRNWLTGALIFLFVGVFGVTGQNFYQAYERLQETRATRQEVEARLSEARRLNQRLQTDLARVTDDSYMELQAKSMGFVYPEETVYQTSPSTGQ